MQSVDFYILSAQDRQEKYLFACHLGYKSWQADMRVHFLCPDIACAEEMDELLWNFREDSFMGHHIKTTEDKEIPLLIEVGSLYTPKKNQDRFLINLSDSIYKNVQAGERLAEIVLNNEEQKQQSRRHYQWFRKHRIPLRVHHIKSSQKN